MINTGTITKCHNDSLSLKLVYLWIFNDLMFSLKFMNMQIRYHILLTIGRKGIVKAYALFHSANKFFFEFFAFLGSQ